MNDLEPCVLVIADISGYTNYLAGVELDHAQDILADLMTTVVGALRPPFRLAKLEGDAAFVAMPLAKADGSQVLDAIDATYLAFRRRIRNIRLSSRCECHACAALPGLDLKFVAHVGEVARHRIAGREELAGRDVIAIHRLLKNTAGESMDGKPYALFTDVGLRALRLDGAALGWAPHQETIDILGTTPVWLKDMAAVWREAETGVSHEVTPEKAAVVYSFDLPAPRPLVWDLMTTPANRAKWAFGIDAVVESNAQGRRGAGTRNHCMHGRDAVIEDILDWRPMEFTTSKGDLASPMGPVGFVGTNRLFDLPGGGTRVERRFGKPRPKESAAFGALLPMLAEIMEKSEQALRALAAATMAERATLAEPELPRSGGRFLSEPVAKGEPQRAGSVQGA